MTACVMVRLACACSVLWCGLLASTIVRALGMAQPSSTARRTSLTPCIHKHCAGGRASCVHTLAAVGCPAFFLFLSLVFGITAPASWQQLLNTLCGGSFVSASCQARISPRGIHYSGASMTCLWHSSRPLQWAQGIRLLGRCRLCAHCGTLGRGPRRSTVQLS
jgi:hypothetical protein